MVDAGIFALLGEAGAIAVAAVWLSFLLAGIVAALLGYMVVTLGVCYPSSDGLIAYLVAGFGNGRLVGIASWLGYFATAAAGLPRPSRAAAPVHPLSS
jgi:amino acid transporter